VLAQTELASALTRLDSEPAPELDPSDSPAVIEEAVARHEELTAPESVEFDAGADDAPSDDVFDVYETAEVDADIIDAAVVDTAPVETGDVDAHTENVVEGSLSTYFGPGASDDSETTGDILASAFGDPAQTADPQGLADDVATEPLFGGWPTTELTDVESVEYEAVGEAIPVDNVDTEAASFAPTEFETTEYVTTEFETTEFETTEYETTEVETTEYVTSEVDDDASAPTLGDFGATEHVVVESAEYGDLPVRGGSDLPVRGQAEVPEPEYPESFGAASLADALPADDAPELGGATQEDALARLVREAMQEAVDSARKND